MSHFTVLIAGEDPEEMLQKYCERADMEPYPIGLVTDEEKYKMIDYYATKDSRNRLISFDSLYKEYGDNWNRSNWRKNPEGVWVEFSRYNPDSKWDWYLLGGRWSGMLKLKKGAKGVTGKAGVFKNETGIDQAHKIDIANLDKVRTYAYLTKDGWFERGTILPFGGSADNGSEEKWKEKENEIIDSISDNTIISIYDLHI